MLKVGRYHPQKIQSSHLKPHYRPYDGFESHLDGWRGRYHGKLMSDTSHKTAVLNKRIVNLSLTWLYYKLMGATPLPKFVRELALDFPESSKSSKEWSLLQILWRLLVGRSGEEGSRDNRSVFQSPWSITLIDLHFVLTASFFKKGEYKEGKFHRQSAQQVSR